MEENKNGLVFSEKSLHLFAGAGGQINKITYPTPTAHDEKDVVNLKL